MKENKRGRIKISSKVKKKLQKIFLIVHTEVEGRSSKPENISLFGEHLKYVFIA